ncbi:hypothetical protein EDB87DRAFT_1569892 [Lactarius vividus]|nr:hypothetical protein EDB87DRAFT_1569892 [Lactarius vividus]
MGFVRRFLSSFAVVSALFLSLPAASAGRSLRQHVEPRASLDVCATIDENSLYSVGLYLPASAFESCINICLCISSLPAAIQANSDLRLLAKQHGVAVVRSDLALLINSAQSRENCYYPDNSHPACTPDNPCAFDCESPFVPRGNKCACPPPYRLCNGVCGMFTHGCGSAAAHPYKRLSPDLRTRSHGIFTHEDALATCDRGERVCGVYQGSAAFECLNTDISLESCGGCMAPNPFLFMSEQGPEGVDCTNIPHVRDIRCSHGRCVVERCEEGFFPSSDRSACICEPESVFAQQGQPKIQAPATHWG